MVLALRRLLHARAAVIVAVALALPSPALAQGGVLSMRQARAEIDVFLRQEIAWTPGLVYQADVTRCTRRSATVVDCGTYIRVRRGAQRSQCSKPYRARLDRGRVLVYELRRSSCFRL